MSVSHLLYYFPSKEAVLEELARRFTDELLGGVASHGEASPEERIRLLVHHVFVGGVLPHGELAIVIEMIALATHHPRIKKIQLNYANQILAYLTDLFREVPRARGLSAEDAALIATAVWMGLIVDSQYMRGLNRDRASKLFDRMLRNLAALEPNGEANACAYPEKSSCSTAGFHQRGS